MATNPPIEFVSGQRGMGKTTYIRTRILNVEPRFLVYDHMAEFYTQGDGMVVYSAKDAISYIKQHPDGLMRLYFVPANPSEEEFRIVCRIPFAYPGLTVVVDELDNFATAAWPPEEFRKLIHFGRHAECGFVGASRRPADVSRAFTSQAQRFVIFRQTEPRDLVYLRSILGDRVLKVKELPPLHYLAFEGDRVLAGTVNPAQ